MEESIEGAVEFLQSSAAADLEDANDGEEEDTRTRPPLPEEIDPQDETAVQQWIEAQEGTIQALVASRLEARQTRARARIERQDRQAKIDEEMNTKVLSQEMVMSLLLPRAKKRWHDLAQMTTMGTLTIEELVKSKENRKTCMILSYSFRFSCLLLLSSS